MVFKISYLKRKSSNWNNWYIHILIIIFLLLGMIFFPASFRFVEKNNDPLCKNGILDLKKWDMEKNGPVKLTGQWEFYWQKYFEHSDFVNNKVNIKPIFIKVPDEWKGRLENGEKILGTGYATLRLIILFNKKENNISIQIPNIYTAFQLFANGELITGKGEIGQSPKDSSPYMLAHVVKLPSVYDRLEILIKMSNFHHRTGGFAGHHILIGKESQIEAMVIKNMYSNFFLIGGIFIISLYYFTTFILTPYEKVYLYFSAVCLLIALRMLLLGDGQIIYIFPNLIWDLAFRLEYISFYLCVPLFGMFMRSLFPLEFYGKVIFFIQILAVFFSLIAIIFPPYYFSYTMPVYQNITILFGLYLLCSSILAIIRKREDAFIFFIGFIFLFLTAINDILLYESIINSVDMTPIGIFLFIIFHAVLLSRRYSKAFTRLANLEKKYREIFENAIEGIFIIGMDGRFLSANSSMARILGYDLNEKYLETSNDLLYSYFDDKYIKRFLRMITENGKVVGMEMEGKRFNKEPFLGSLSAKIVRNEDFFKSYIEGFLVDITDQRKKEEAEREKMVAEAANQTKSAFIANMSHEFRTPINLTMGFVEILQKEITDKRHIEYLSSINDSCGILLNLINDILDMSKIEAKKMNLDNSPVSIIEIADEMKQMFNYRIFEKGLKFQINIDPLIPGSVVIDKIRLRQILLNVIGNAIKFTDKGFIKFDVIAYFPKRQNDAKVNLIFSVKDTGVGISPDQMEVIFEPFIQQKGHESSKYGGTGLGLAITKRLIEMMGGEILLESKVGEGSTFKLIFKDIPFVESKKIYKENEFKENKKSYNDDLSKKTLSLNEISLLKELYQLLTEEVMKEWEEIQKTLYIDKIMLFSEKIQTIGKKYDYIPIIKWGDDLKQSSDVFDVETLIELLKNFSSILIDIEKIIN